MLFSSFSKVTATRGIVTAGVDRFFKQQQHTVVRCMSSVINLSTADAVEKFLIMNSKVILYYTATWCGPCRQIKPLYEEMSKTYSEEIMFGKVDVDDNPDSAQKAQISAVPTFVAYMNETQVNRFSGADTNQLRTMAEKLKNE